MTDVTVVIAPDALESSKTTLDGEAYHHLFRVRRLAAGQELRLVDGRASARLGRVAAVGTDSATIEIGAPLPTNESSLALELWVAPPRSRRAAWLVEKATEVGVTAVRFISTLRGGRELAPAGIERLRRVALAAVEQCHRTRIPVVSGQHAWGECLEQLEGSSTWVLVPGGPPAAEIPLEGAAAVVVGPEGGWTDEEESQLLDRGANSIGLGPRVLRVETAAIVGAARILSSA